MSESLLLDEKIVALSAALRDASIEHAFGGALALAYYGTPRGTTDIDLNVFVGTEYVYALAKILSNLGADDPNPRDLAKLDATGQLRVMWDHTPIDLFFAYDDFHRSCSDRVREVPFAAAGIAILSPEDLVVFKTIYGRGRDFRDIQEIFLCMGDELDLDYTLRWLERFMDENDERIVKLHQAMVERGLTQLASR